MAKLLDSIDVVIGSVVLLIAGVAPWMLGATTWHTIWVLNCWGFLAGGLWLLKLLTKSQIVTCSRPTVVNFGARLPMVFVWVFVIGLLSYVLCSALNPKSSLQYTFTPGYPFASGVEIDYLEPIDWLPQSHDQGRTLGAFWKYLAIVLSFVAARNWLMTPSRREGRSRDIVPRFPGDHAQWLLWTLAISSAVLAFVGMLQRLDGAEKLLWTFPNHINRGQGAFGPFPYQSNGAQYLNLIWPVTIGFWWILRRRNIAGRAVAHRAGGDPYVLLLLLGALTAAGVVVAKSRGGVIVLAGLLMLLLTSVMFVSRRQTGLKLAMVAAVLGVLGLGWWLGGEAMLARFRSEDFGVPRCFQWGGVT
jgi:hypothetical protein